MNVIEVDNPVKITDFSHNHKRNSNDSWYLHSMWR